MLLYFYFYFFPYTGENYDYYVKICLLYPFTIIFITYSIRLFDRHRGSRDHCGNVTERRTAATLSTAFSTVDPPSLFGACAYYTPSRALRRLPHNVHS